MLTSPNPGLEAAIDYSSLFRCGPAFPVRVLWMDSSRDAAAQVLGNTNVLNFPASLCGAFWGGVLGDKDCAVAAGLLLVGVGEYIYIYGLNLCQVDLRGDAPGYPRSVSTRLDLRQNPEGV